MSLSHSERNSRAIRALAGLMLVFAVAMVWAHGKLQKKLEAKFTTYIVQNDQEDYTSDEYLDVLIKVREERNSRR